MISGVQEVALIYAGVITTLPCVERNPLMTNIGGGSTEVIIGRKHKRLLTENLVIGSVAWLDRFLSEEKATFDELQVVMSLAIEAARNEFEVVAPAVKIKNWSKGSPLQMLLKCWLPFVQPMFQPDQCYIAPTESAK